MSDFERKNALVHFHCHWNPETGEYKGARVEYEAQVLENGVIVAREYKEENTIHEVSEASQQTIANVIGKLALDAELALETSQARVAELETQVQELQAQVAALTPAPKSPVQF